ncbi:MAG: CATRA conflict system CASPASE/TPR repeat-associated protein [Streptosporangiaceae bacterium]
MIGRGEMPPGDGYLTAPALLAHLFLKGASGSVWDDITGQLGLDQRVPGLQVPVRLSGPLSCAGTGLLAAAERGDPSVWQASAWAADGLLGITVMLAPPRYQDCQRTWHELEQAWERATMGIDPEVILGESRVFLALTSAPPELGPAPAGSVLLDDRAPVEAIAPPPSRLGWWHQRDAVPVDGTAQILLWEIGPDTSDARIRRRLIAVAPATAEREADRFTWTSGAGGPSQLTRHLTHAARLRYQVRVFADGAYPRQVRDEIGTLIDDLAAQPGQADRLAASLRNLHGTAIALRRRLDAMRHAVSIIEDNLRLALDWPPSQGIDGPVSADRRLAAWFGQRITDEISLLDAAVVNAQSARDFLAQETAPPAESRRRPRTGTPSAIIFTSMGIEYTAIRDYLHDVQRYQENATLYEVGTLAGPGGSWQVALAETGPGSTMAGVHLDRAVRVFAPEVALYLGVAGGRKDVALGDVVAADTIYDYEWGKSTADGFQPRMRTHYPAYRLVQWARMVAREGQWQRHIRPSCPEPPPAAFVKPIVTGGKVIAHDHSDAALLLDRYAGDALAVETEGHGFLVAAYANTDVDALVIRGISDLMTGKDKANDDHWQPVASRHAAAFAVELLRGIVSLGLQWHEFAGELGHEGPQRLGRAGGAHDELAQAGLGVPGDQGPRRRPSAGDQRRRVGARPSPLDRRGQPIRDATEGDRQADPEMIGVHFPSGLVGCRPYRLDRRARFIGGEQRAEPSVGQPSHSPQPGRRRAAKPDVQRLGGQRTDRRALHREERAVERHDVGREHQPQQGQRLVEHRAALPGRYRKQRALGGDGWLQAEHRQHPAGREARERGELLGDQHGMASGQYRDSATRLQVGGLRQRERHAGERLDRGPVHVLRQPQRVDARRFQQADRRLELAGCSGRTQRYPYPDSHTSYATGASPVHSNGGSSNASVKYTALPAGVR